MTDSVPVVYALSDGLGFVGLFTSPALADAVQREYPLIPFIVQEFSRLQAVSEDPSVMSSAPPTASEPAATAPLMATEPAATEPAADRAWIVLYRDIDAVAWATTSYEDAQRRKQALDRVGLSYPEPVDRWEVKLNQVMEFAKTRLDAQKRAHVMFATESVEAAIQQREADDIARFERLRGGRPGPIEQFLKENETVSVLDAVEAAPVPVEPESEDEVPALVMEIAGAESAFA